MATETKHTVMFLDDEIRTVESTGEALEGDFNYFGFTKPDDFYDAVMAHPEPLILLVDHNLGLADHFGYDTVLRVRRDHPFGLILPIIYFTANQTPLDFITEIQAKLGFTPSALVHKGDDRYFDVVEEAGRMLNQLTALALSQSFKQAMTAPPLDDEDFTMFDEVDE